MAATYAWLTDQERAAIEKRNKATRRWVEQQQRSSTSPVAQPLYTHMTAAPATQPRSATHTYPATRLHVPQHAYPTVPPPHPTTHASLHANTTTQPPHPSMHAQSDQKKRPRTRGKDPEEERQHRERRLELQQEFELMEARWRDREMIEAKIRAEREMQEARGRRERELQEQKRREREMQEERRRKADWKRAEEKRMRDEERRVRAEEMRRREVQRVRDAWMVYERRWAALLGSGGHGGEALTFWNIPWPVLHPPRSVHDITSDAVSSFILSDFYSEGIAKRERVREALRRWHPDRFGRLKGRVRAEEWAVVEYGVGVVVRCLNKLLEQESLAVGGMGPRGAGARRR